MGSRVTIKGQVTIPKQIRSLACIEAGDEVEFSIDDDGRIALRHADRQKRLKLAMDRIRRDPPIKGMTTDEIMRLTRGEKRWPR